jgi:hypothetical protein
MFNPFRVVVATVLLLIDGLFMFNPFRVVMAIVLLFSEGVKHEKNIYKN